MWRKINKKAEAEDEFGIRPTDQMQRPCGGAEAAGQRTTSVPAHIKRCPLKVDDNLATVRCDVINLPTPPPPCG